MKEDVSSASHSSLHQELVRAMKLPPHTIQAYVKNDQEVDDADREMMRHMAGCRFNIMYCDINYYLVYLAVEYRFYELRMALYQWKRKHLVISYRTFQEKHHLRLAERIISQFREILNRFTGYYPMIRDHPDYDGDQEHRKHEYGGTGCPRCIREAQNSELTLEEQELTLLTVELVKNIMLVMDIYEKKILCNDCHFSLDVALSWFQKMTYFFKTLQKSFRLKERTVIVTYEYHQIGRNEKRWRDIVELDTMLFIEICSPEKPEPSLQDVQFPPIPDTFEHDEICSLEKLESLLQDVQFPPIPDTFNYDEIACHLQMRWNQVSQCSDTVVYHPEMDQETTSETIMPKRTKKKGKKGKKRKAR